jgi:hypothetical protein
VVVEALGGGRGGGGGGAVGNWGGCGSRMDEVKRSDSRGLGSRENRGLLMTTNGVNSCLSGVFLFAYNRSLFAFRRKRV